MVLTFVVGVLGFGPAAKTAGTQSSTSMVTAQLQVSPTTVVNGGIARVTLITPQALKENPKLKFLDWDLPFYEVSELKTVESTGQVWEALVPIPFMQNPGKVPFVVSASSLKLEGTQEFTVADAGYASEVLKVDPKHVSPPKAVLKRIQKESKLAGAAYAVRTPEKLWQGPFQRPLDTPLTSVYGTKRVYNGELKSAHKGVDFRASVGTPIVAPARGRVVLAQDMYYSGGTVILDHGFGLMTVYMHLSRLQVKKGKMLNPGDRIGLSGATGRVSGPHLHWGAVLYGEKVSPMDLLGVVR